MDDRKSDEKKGNDVRKGNDESNINCVKKGNDRESCESEKAEVPDAEALDNLMMEQMRKQVRSDYRRSLGNENRRRYLE